MPVKKNKINSSKKNTKIKSLNDKNMEDIKNILHPHINNHYLYNKYKSHHSSFSHKLLLTFIGILLVYLIVFIGALIRNEIKKYDYIGISDRLERTIVVDAVGTVDIKPDIATLRMGVTTQGETIQEVQTENTKKMNALNTKFKELGILEDDIKTTNYSVHPRYDWSADEGSELAGYEVSQSVVLKMRDTSLAEKVLSFVGELGITDVGQLKYIIDDKDIYLAKARKDALKKIADKASTLSNSLGVNFVNIVSYDEYESSVNSVPKFNRMFAETGINVTNSPILEEGTNEVSLNVSVSFEIR